MDPGRTTPTGAGRRGGRSHFATGRGSWGPSPLHRKFVGGEGNSVDESSSRSTGGLSSIGRGWSSHQISPARESVLVSGSADVPSRSKNPIELDEKAVKVSGGSDPEQADQLRMENSGFDICLPKKIGTPILKPTLFARNREKRNSQRSMEMLNGSVLRPGMVLLKHYLSLETQVKIVNLCRQLGVGSGGFYQPEYRSGEKLHLKMMCLGSNWEPDSDRYVETRAVDHAKPPKIPQEFVPLVMDAIRDSQTLIARTSKPAGAGENVLPSMSPTICVVNFYDSAGRLGLHQDKAESPESLRKGLPVVSFSIGDSAEFKYADRRDDASAEEKVTLESGDVLIFGGRSRNIFHGVSSVKQGTAPKSLLEQTNMRKGRLNLTFREY